MAEVDAEDAAAHRVERERRGGAAAAGRGAVLGSVGGLTQDSLGEQFRDEAGDRGARQARGAGDADPADPAAPLHGLHKQQTVPRPQ